MNLKGRSFLKLLDFTPEEILCFVDRADELKAQKKAGIPHRNHIGKNVALIFEKTSTRTRCSFEVAASATKEDVAHAVEAIYNVKPTKVNIVVVKGKVKSFRGRSAGTQRTVKKAYVSLPADAKLDLSANVQ